MSAAALRAEAAAFDELAVRITGEARELGSLIDPVLARLGSDVWRGPAAEFATAASGWRRRLDDEASTLLEVARRVRQRADELRAEAVRVDLAEAAAQRERAEAAARRMQQRLAAAP